MQPAAIVRDGKIFWRIHMENEFKINMYEVLKTRIPAGRTSSEDCLGGDTIRNLIEENWDKYEKISVFFEGIVKMTRPFVDEAFAKLLEKRSLEEFNKKMHFPDANDPFVKALNDAFKLRLKILRAQREREDAKA